MPESWFFKYKNKYCERDKPMSIKELMQRLEQLQGKDKYLGSERRKFVRLTYPPKKRPVLKVKNYELEVLDVSERGMRLLNYKQHKIDQNIRGTIVFLCGISIEVAGEIAWQYRNELGLFTTRIPRSIIEEEMYALLREKDSYPN